jgi:tetratricopeptide (TPR) repeat protein
MRTKTRIRTRRLTSRCAAALASWLIAGQLFGQATGPEPPGEDLRSLRAARNALIAADDFAPALNLAREIVTGLEPLHDPGLPEDLMHLARVEAELDMFDEAERSYLKAAQILRDAQGQFSKRLILPYQALGRAYIKARKFPEAISVLEQAQHLSQRNDGLFNLDQTPLIDDLTTATLGLGDTVKARELQQQRLEHAIRELGADAPGVIPYYYHLADYYERSRMPISARGQYEKAVAIRQEADGPMDPRLLEPLRAMTRIDMQLGRGEQAHDRLVEVLSTNADYDARERALSLAVLGDWALVHDDDDDAAREQYLAAYEALAASDPKSAEATFAAPSMIDFIAPLSAVDRAERRKPYAWGDIVLHFDVSADGRASNVTTASIDPENRIGAAYERRVLETHFRPGLAAGRPVATRGVEFHHLFRYYVDD